VARIGSLITILLWAAAALADPAVELTVDRTQAAVGEEITAQVTVTGVRSAPEPQVEGLANFDVERGGTSTQVQIINGSAAMSVAYNYLLVPKKAGTFTLGPAKVTVAGSALSSESIAIQVAAGAPQAAVAPSSRPFQVLADIDNPQAYVGQQVIYTFQFLSRGELHNAQLDLPEFKGFLKEELGKQRQYQTVKNGVRWGVTEIRFALFPTQAGDLPIEPAVLLGEALEEEPGGRGGSPFDDLFDHGFFARRGRMKRVRLQSPGILVKVSELPAAGKPASFSGIVGNAAVKQTLSKDSVTVGDSVTWTVEISGEGNLRDARWEPAVPAGFKVYDDQPAFHLRLQGNRVGGTKIFKKALVPLEAGAKELPPVEVSYFDPEKRAYRTVKTESARLQVAPGQGVSGPALPAARQAVTVRGEDILAPRWQLSEVGADALSPKDRLYLILLWVLGPLSAGVAAGLRAFRDKRGRNPARARRQKAYGSFRKQAVQWNDSASFDAMASALRSYLGDRFDTDGGALTPLDVREKLGSRGVDEKFLRETEEVLELCERGRYGGGGNPAALKERVTRLVDGLEKEVRS
jgi:hypothetical protein